MQYMASHLRGNAFIIIKDRIPQEGVPNPLLTRQDIFTALNQMYHEPNKKQKTYQEYTVLIQDNNNFNTFHTKFKHMATYLRQQEFKKISDLKQKLNTHYFKASHYQSFPNYTSFCEHLQGLQYNFNMEDQIQTRPEHSKHNSRQKSSRQTHTNTQDSQNKTPSKPLELPD